MIGFVMHMLGLDRVGKPEYKIDIMKGYDGKIKYTLHKRDMSYKTIVCYDFISSYDTLDQAEDAMEFHKGFPRYYANNKRIG